MDSIHQMPSTQRSIPQNPALSKKENLLASQKNLKWSLRTKAATTFALATSVLSGSYLTYEYLTKGTSSFTISPYASFESIKTTFKALFVLGVLGLGARAVISKSKTRNQKVDDKYNEGISFSKTSTDKNDPIINKKNQELTNEIILLLNNNELEKVEEITSTYNQILLNRLEENLLCHLANMSQTFITNETIIKNSKNEIILFLDSINNFIIKKNKKHPDNIINFFNTYYGYINFGPTTILLKILSEYKNDTEIKDRIFKLVYSFMNEATEKLSTENNDLQTDIERIISYFMDEHPKFYAHFIQHSPDSAGKFAFFYQKKCRDKDPFYLEFTEPFAFKILKDVRTCLFQDSLDHTTDEIRNNEAIFAISFLGNYFVERDDQGKPPARLIKLYNDLRNKETIEKTLNEMLNAKVKPCKASIELTKVALEVHHRVDLLPLLKERENEIICNFFNLNHNIDPFKLLKLRKQVSQIHNSSDTPDSSQTDHEDRNRLQLTGDKI